jgi:glycosyltransferase involved in cell wall biosynthesis
MNDKPAISVVVPAYNVGQYLGEALDSVMRQIRPPDEVIVIDDGSTDNTPKEAQKFAGRVRYIKQPNSGPSAARNLGIRQSKGDWIAFLDGDDTWLPWHLGEVWKVKTLQPETDLFCGRTAGMNEDIRKPDETGPAKLEDITLVEFVKCNPVATSTAVVRKEALIAAGGFDISFRGPEDYDLWMRIVKKYRALYIDMPLARYRSLPGSLSMDDRSFLPQVLRVLDKAFREEGALREYLDYKNSTYAKQYWNASWMAFERGSRMRALAYLTKAFILLKKGKPYPLDIDFKWIPLLLRYSFGRR